MRGLGQGTQNPWQAPPSVQQGSDVVTVSGYQLAQTPVSDEFALQALDALTAYGQNPDISGQSQAAASGAPDLPGILGGNVSTTFNWSSWLWLAAILGAGYLVVRIA